MQSPVVSSFDDSHRCRLDAAGGRKKEFPSISKREVGVQFFVPASAIRVNVVSVRMLLYNLDIFGGVQTTGLCAREPLWNQDRISTTIHI